ncbi:MAG: hypothetical protein EOP06_16970 [Proteobacteria bacterium]|nr:MAG: hypothetical protein EOP06_16970 [Pseudomonadota bacterium]
MDKTLVISVDPVFLHSDDDRDVDFWIVGSEANIREAAVLREMSRVKSVTTFDNLGDALANVTSMLPTIVEHHPDATCLVVRGVELSQHRDLIESSEANWTGMSADEEVVLWLDRSAQ